MRAIILVLEDRHQRVVIPLHVGMVLHDDRFHLLEDQRQQPLELVIDLDGGHEFFRGRLEVGVGRLGPDWSDQQ